MDPPRRNYTTKDSYQPRFSSNERLKCAVTFTEVEEDVYKIKVEELLENGNRVDLLHRESDLPGFTTIFERTDLHLTKEGAQELWEMIQPEKEDLMLDSNIDNEGHRFVEVILLSKYLTTKATHYLEKIAESLYAQQKREAAKAAKAAKKKGGSLRKSGRGLLRKSLHTKHY